MPCGCKGQKVSKGDFLTEGYATKGGEIALGRNTMKVALHAMEGLQLWRCDRNLKSG